MNIIESHESVNDINLSTDRINQPKDKKLKLDWALDFQKQGLAVFPLWGTNDEGLCDCGNEKCKSAGKHPRSDLAPNGVKNASLDPDDATAWLDGTNNNYGVSAGEGHVIVDLDRKNSDKNGAPIDGVSSFCSYIDTEEWGLSELTFIVETTTGGQHLYFKSPIAAKNRTNLIPGVDIRGEGGYVVGPGSRIGNKFYTPLSDQEIVDAPESIKVFLAQAREKQTKENASLITLDRPENIRRAREMLKLRAPATEGMGGNSHTLNTCMQVRDMALSMDACLDLLLEADGWNERCEPPWSKDELEQLVINAYEYATDEIGSKGGGLIEMHELGAFGTDEEISADIDRMERKTKKPESLKSSTGKFQSVTYNFKQAVNLKRSYQFIVEKLIPVGGYTGLLAERGLGKTTVMIDLGLCLATDRDWHGYATKKGWGVYYFAGEDSEGVLDRLRAWKHRYNNGADITDPSRFMLHNAPIDLCDSKEMEAVTEHVRQVMPNRSVLFMYDTFQRMIGSAGGGQNDDRDMQLAANHIDALSQSFNGGAIVAFHPPKGNKETVTGSKVLENSSNAIIQITKERQWKRLETTRLKGGPEGETISFEFASQSIGGMDDFGKPRHGAVFVPRSDPFKDDSDFADVGYDTSNPTVVRVADSLKLFDNPIRVTLTNLSAKIANQKTGSESVRTVQNKIRSLTKTDEGKKALGGLYLAKEDRFIGLRIWNEGTNPSVEPAGFENLEDWQPDKLPS